MYHSLKILPQFFEDVLTGFKNAEVRFDDRGYSVGDCLMLKEYCDGSFTGRSLLVYVIGCYDLSIIGVPGYKLLCFRS